MLPEAVLSHPTVERVGWTLIHFLWQAAALAAMFTVELALLRKSKANVRYLAGCVTLALMVLAPCLTMFVVPVSESGFAVESDAMVSIPPAASIAEFAGPVEVSVSEGPHPGPAPSIEAARPDVAVRPAHRWKERATTLMEPALPYMVLAWLVGVFGLSVWHLGGWAQLQRLRRRMVKSVEPALHSKLKELAELLGVRRAVVLMESALVQVPTVVGWLKPVILLPASALTGLSPEQMEAILAHELAHIRRLDYLVNMLQTAVEILGFYHPAVWWVSHKIRVERENCCDDVAVSVTGDKVRYAKALALLEEMRGTRPGLAVAASGGSLLGRIRRLVGKGSREEGRYSWLPAAITVLLILAIAVPTTVALSSREDKKADVKVGEGASPEILRVVYECGKGEDCYLDFDTGRMYSQPQGLSDDANARGHWCRRNGIDATVAWREGGRLGLLGIGLWAAAVEPQLWETGPEQVTTRLQALDLQKNFFMDYDGPGSTFVFRTREGGAGVVQIRDGGTDAGRYFLRLRYKSSAMRGVAISGRVLSQPGGTGAAGVLLVLQTGLGLGLYATTDEHGYYRFAPVEAAAQARGMNMWVEEGTQAAGTWRPGLALAVADKDVAAEDLFLTLPQRISGTVRDADTGEPARAGVKIRISKVPCPLDELETDSQGRYCFYVKPGQYTLWCRGSEQRYYEFGADRASREKTRTVAVAAGDVVEDADFQVQSAPAFHGIVLLPDGQPAGDVDVFVRIDSIRPPILDDYAGPDYSELRVRTDADGRFVGYMRAPMGMPENRWDENVTVKAIARLADGSMGGMAFAQTGTEDARIETMRIVLAECGTATVHLVDSDGKDVTDSSMTAEAYAGRVGRFSRNHLAGLLRVRDGLHEVKGRRLYKIGGLIPGLQYDLDFSAQRSYLHGARKVIISQPGQQVDLGTVVLERQFGPQGGGEPVNGLQARLTVQQIHREPEPQVVLGFRLRNVGTEPVRIMRLGIQRNLWGDCLPVEVRIGGHIVPYHGPVDDPNFAIVKDHYFDLQPGRTDSIEAVMIPKYWGLDDLSAAEVTFVFENTAESVPPIPITGLWTGKVRSNTVKLGAQTDVEVAATPEVADISGKPVQGVLEAEVSEVVKVIRLKYADPEDLSERLNAIFSEPGTVTGMRLDEMGKVIAMVRFIPDPRSKAILVLCPPELMGSVEKMIRELDRPGSGIRVRNFSATLSNGATVELVGLYHGETIKDLVFWKPDGSLFSDSESQKYRERVALPKWQNKDFRFEYGLMMRFSPLDELNAEVFINQGHRMSSKSPGSDGIATALVASDPHEREEGFSKVGNIKAAAAYGEWDTRKWSAGINDPSVLFLDEHSNIMLSPPRRSDERVGGRGYGGYGGYGRSSPRRKTDEWVLDVTINVDNIDFDCFYELKDGSIHQAKWRETLGQPIWIGPDQRTPMICKRYALSHKPQDITQYIVKYRKFEIVEFKNVSLKPGVKTDVEVVVGHAAPEMPSEPGREGRLSREEISAKLAALEERRKAIQKDLNFAEKAMGDVRRRFGLSDLEERSYPHPVTARLMRLENERDDCLVEIAQLEARIWTIERQPDSPQKEKDLKKAREDLAVLKGKLEQLQKMCAEAAARKNDLDTARVQYKQVASIRDERKRMLDSVKEQIEKLRILHDDPAAPEGGGREDEGSAKKEDDEERAYRRMMEKIERR